MYEPGQIQLHHSEGLSLYVISKRICKAANMIRNELKRGTLK
jgi:IS30 family transposase